MDNTDQKLNEVVELFTSHCGVPTDDVTPDGNKSPIPLECLTDEDMFGCLREDFSMLSGSEIIDTVKDGKTPFQVVRGYVSRQISELNEVQQVTVLNGLLGSQSDDLCDLKDFIHAEIEILLHPENY